MRARGKLARSIVRACLPSSASVFRMRFAVAELLQPRQLRADIPSTRRCCRRCWPTNSERGRRGPRQRKHPLRSPARERRAAGAAAPGEADERRQRPLDNLRPTGAEHGSRSRRAGEKPRAHGGSGSGGRYPPRSGASAWPRLGARGPRRGEKRREEMEKSRHASAELCSIYRI